MTNTDKGRFRNLTLPAGFVALALVAGAFLHLCLCSAGHGEGSNSTHQCLLCTIFSCTILSPLFLGLVASLSIVHLPLSLEPICSGTPSVLVSVPVRAPPSTGLNR